jgi:hypothetical protein
MWVGRLLLFFLKLFLLLVVTAMVRFQMPELRYDLGEKEPVHIESPEELSFERFPEATFVAIHGRADLTKAATFAKHGVRYTYLLLEEYGPRLVVRTAEEVSEEWAQIDVHMGRLRAYPRMAFDSSVGAGFRSLFDVEIAEDAFFLGRDDVPGLNGWNLGAVIFACVLWCVLFYFFFLHGWIKAARRRLVASLGEAASPHHGEPEPTGDEPGDNRSRADEDA